MARARVEATHRHDNARAYRTSVRHRTQGHRARIQHERALKFGRITPTETG
jgi:hypothetical protein